MRINHAVEALNIVPYFSQCRSMHLYQNVVSITMIIQFIERK